MPQLANDRHERFARAVADGMRTVDAYEAAGYPRSASSASQLKSRPEVSARIAELMQEDLDRRAADDDDMDNLPSELNRDWLLRTLMKNISIAQKQGQIAPANKAVEMLAELIGFSFKKPTPPPAPGDTDDDAPDLDMDRFSDAFSKLATVLPAGDAK